LVNLILDKPAIQELIQQEMKAENMIDFLHKIETGPEREKVLEFYQELHQHLGGIGASGRAAEKIISQCLD
jgi:lipid-A-disaccharide synthase